MNRWSKQSRRSPLVIDPATARCPQRHCPSIHPQDRGEPLAPMSDGRYKVQTTGVRPAVFAKLIQALSEAVMTMRRGSRPRAALMVAAACLSLVLAGCTSDPAPGVSPSSSTPSPTSPSPSTTPADPAVAAASQAALASYRGYWQAQARSQANPAKPQDPNLAKYATGSALAGAQSTLLTFRQSGIAMKGAPSLDPRVTSVDNAIRNVSITDCVDTSNWKPIYIANGKSALAPGQPLRVVVDSVVTASRGSWAVSTSVVHRDQSC
jgi:hypothetical protein